MAKTASYLFPVALCTLKESSVYAAQPPLALGLVAIIEPVPMKCENGVCDAVVSVFCLQQHLLSPFSKKMYREAKRGNVHAAARTFAGLEVTSPSDAPAFQSDPEYTAMKVSALTFSGLNIALSSVRLAISPGTLLLRWPSPQTRLSRPPLAHIAGSRKRSLRMAATAVMRSAWLKTVNQRATTHSKSRHKCKSVRTTTCQTNGAQSGLTGMGRTSLSQLRQACENLKAFKRSSLPRRLASSIDINNEQDLLVHFGRRLSQPRHEFHPID